MEQHKELLLTDICQQSESLRKEIPPLRTAIADVQARNADLEKEYQQCENLQRGLQTTLEERENLHRGLKAALERREKIHHELVALWEERLEVHYAKLRKETETNIWQQSENESLRKEISQLKAEIAELQTWNANLKKKNQVNIMQPSENKSLRKEISQLKAEISDLQTRNANLEKENQGNFILKWINESFRKEISQLKAGIAADLQARNAFVFQIFRQNQAEKQCNLEGRKYRKATRRLRKGQEEKTQTSKGFVAEHGHLDETGRSVHDEVEEAAEALKVEEEKLTVVAFKGKNDVKHSKYQLFKFFVAFIRRALCFGF